LGSREWEKGPQDGAETEVERGKKWEKSWKTRDREAGILYHVGKGIIIDFQNIYCQITIFPENFSVLEKHSNIYDKERILDTQHNNRQ